MKSNLWIRAILLGILIAALGVPSGSFTTHAQQEGPQKSSPAQSTEPPKPPTGQQQPPQAGQSQAPQVAISVESNVVNIDAVVTDQEGNILSELKKENFRILDESHPQQISNFAPSEAPITIVVLMEFSHRIYGYFGYRAKEWAFGFLSHLNDKDYVALKTFDLRTKLIVDFTRDKREVAQGLSGLYWPEFSEANLFDALLETLDELRDVKGKKSILVLASGYDTLSRHTLDQTLKRVKETDIPIYCVGMGEALDARGLHAPTFGGRDTAEVTYLQAKNQLTTFAEMTGGYAWFPRFEGEMSEIFNSVAAFLRSQYTMGFTPSSSPDGKYHKIKLEVVDEAGNPMMLADKKGHKKKVIVYARQGYTSLRPTAGD